MKEDLVSYRIGTDRTRGVWRLCLLFCLVFALSPWAGGAATAPVKPMEGKTVGGKAVGFQDERGNTFFLHDFRGRIVILNLWASWCAPCVRELPTLAALQQEFKSRGVVVLAVSEDDKFSDAVQFYHRLGIRGLTPFLDQGHLVWLALHTRGIPISVMIDRKGRQFNRIEGPIDWHSDKMRAYLTKILAIPER